MSNCTIIIPTHSSYIDICKLFLSLLRINWADCSYHIVVSVTGDKVSIEGCECIYNGTNATLTNCIVNAARHYSSDCYMVFLGDAFILDKVDNTAVEHLLDSFVVGGFQYCSLRPQRSIHAKKKYSNLLRYINRKDRYSHSFVAFLASPNFIREEFEKCPNKTDLDFEMKYLALGHGDDCDYYYSDHLVVIGNLLSINPGILKGRWDRSVYNKLKRKYPEIKLPTREKIPVKWQIIITLICFFRPYIPNGLRTRMKKIILRKEKNGFLLRDDEK